MSFLQHKLNLVPLRRIKCLQKSFPLQQQKPDPSLTSSLLCPQRVSSGAEGSVRVLEAAVRRSRPPAGHQQASDQRLALPEVSVSRHHVAVALLPDAGVSRRPHVPDAHAHRQGHPEPRQLHQVSENSQHPCFCLIFTVTGSNLGPKH